MAGACSSRRCGSAACPRRAPCGTCACSSRTPRGRSCARRRRCYRHRRRRRTGAPAQGPPQWAAAPAACPARPWLPAPAPRLGAVLPALGLSRCGSHSDAASHRFSDAAIQRCADEVALADRQAAAHIGPGVWPGRACAECAVPWCACAGDRRGGRHASCAGHVSTVRVHRHAASCHGRSGGRRRERRHRRRRRREPPTGPASRLSPFRLFAFCLFAFSPFATHRPPSPASRRRSARELLHRALGIHPGALSLAVCLSFDSIRHRAFAELFLVVPRPRPPARWRPRRPPPSSTPRPRPA
jgi:hypothetical protein